MRAPTICLNMIVRNERANLERFLGSVAGHIDCWVIGDTGSSDGTPEFIRAFFAERGLPGELHSVPFADFGQARNELLDRARESELAFDYLLSGDSDQELVVENRDFRSRLEAPSYDLLQRAGVSCWHTRLVRRDARAHYRGLAHSYLEVPEGGERLHGVWYRDHADGSDRAGALKRDIQLLMQGIRQEPENPRYWFHLAQSLKESGHPAEAARLFAKRAGLGGREDEAWYARLQQARCLLSLHDEDGFRQAAFAAYNQRPHRAEPLYDLARYYRERGMHDASLLFAEAGLALGSPDRDTSFIEEFVYATGLHEEYSIAGFYSRDPARKERGHAECDFVALSREAPPASRNLARSNLFWYTGPAGDLLPSFDARLVEFVPPDGWRATNPSVARLGQQIVVVQRCVNYTLTETGEYQTQDGSPIATRNFLLRLNLDQSLRSSVEILPPADLPPPAFNLVLGFEDARPFVWRGDLWCSSMARQLTPEGWCEMVLARIDCPPDEPARLADWRVLRPDGPRQHEKNWTLLAGGGDPRFIHSCDPVRVLNHQAHTLWESPPSIAAEPFRGATQAIAFDGGWLALMHEVSVQDGASYYWHRFVWFDEAVVLRGVSRQFFLQRKGMEFASGLAWHPDGERLLISYGVDDCEALIATAAAAEVRAILTRPSRALPTGMPDAPPRQRVPADDQSPAERSQTVERALTLETAS